MSCMFLMIAAPPVALARAISEPRIRRRIERACKAVQEGAMTDLVAAGNTTRYPDPMRSRTALFANVKSKVSDYLRTCFAVVGNKLAETRCGAMPRFATPRERTLWLTHMQGVRGMSLPRLLRVLQGENKWSSVVQVRLGHADPIETLF